MFREHWHEPRFWVWWVRKRVPVPVRWTLGYIGVVAVLGAGFLAADRLSQVNAGGQTPFATSMVKPPGSSRVVTHPVVRYVPVVRKTNITIAGKKQVVTRTLLVPTVRTETATITNEQMVVNHNTSTVVKVVVETLPVTLEQTTTHRRDPDTAGPDGHDHAHGDATAGGIAARDGHAVRNDRDTPVHDGGDHRAWYGDLKQPRRAGEPRVG